MENIRVADLPEPVAQAIATMVAVIRQQLGIGKHEEPQKLPDLPVWEGAVIGQLTREEIYDDAV